MSTIYNTLFRSPSKQTNENGAEKKLEENGESQSFPIMSKLESDNKLEDATNDVDPLASPQETTSLLERESSDEKKIVTVQDYFFPANNPTIQRYYRFTASPTSPFAALHKRPGSSDAGGVTGLLRRSAVLPSHGTDRSGEWILVSVGGRSGWARKRRTMATGGFVMARQFHGTEGWMGNHIFLLNGRIMLGSDAPLFFFTNALLITGVSLYCILFLPKLEDPSWLFTRQQNYIITGILFVLSMATLWISALTDPGILPAVSSPTKPSVPTDGVVGGPLGYRYCSTCNIFRPPRSKHCNSCNVCVSKFDHHCPWVGNCIGERNHHYFFMFLTSVSVLTIVTSITCFQILFQAYVREVVDTTPLLPSRIDDVPDCAQRLWSSIVSMPVLVLFGLFVLLCAWSLVSLLLFHAMIISVAQTTNERVRNVYQYGRNENVDDHGCCQNWRDAFCRPRPRSLLPKDFTDIVVCDHARPESLWKSEIRQSEEQDRIQHVNGKQEDESS
mmetsp:Transcript_8248/g.12687  ORF Transcript_8248/g.12687 Transcript_8248/m.12687 type:complete len:501 (+) Transcript_8248:129-1631(+)